MNFKHTVSRLTAGLLLTASLVTPALAATGTVNTEGSTLRLRSQASTDSAVLAKLPHNAQLNVIDRPDSGCYHVLY